MLNEEITLEEQLHDYLQTYAKSIKLIEPKFHITKGCKNGDNYVGRLYRIRVQGTKNGDTKKFHFILKVPQTNGFDAHRLMSREMFQREIFFYREILPTFKEIFTELGGAVYRIPTLYDANDECGKEVLILENLTREGFFMKNSRILDYPHASLAIRYLGEFHAYSFIARTANPASFEKFKIMKDPLFCREVDHYGVLNHSNEFCKIVKKALSDEDKHYSDRFQQFSDNFVQNMIDVTDGSSAEPYAVVNHGDAWTNNMLFKYKQECSQERIPYDLRFIDFQLCRYASPVLDIVYMLFCCCTQEMRSKYYDQLINEYHESLSKCLESFGYDPNVLFPYEILSQHLRTYGKFAAGMAIYVIHLFTDAANNDEEITSKNDINNLEVRLQNDGFYKSMLKGTFKDLIDKNYL